MLKEATDGSEKPIQEKKKQTNKQTRNDEEREVAEREAPKHDYLILRAPLSISEISFLV